MKAVYLDGSIILSDEQRKAFRGCRLENAAAFGGVARGVDSAEVIGDYPKIVAALKQAGVEVLGGNTEKPDLASWLSALDDKPLVREADAAGFDVSGAEITAAWNELNPD